MKYATYAALLVIFILCFIAGRQFQENANEIDRLSEQRFRLGEENSRLKNKIHQQYRELTRTMLEIEIIKNDINTMHQLLRGNAGGPNKGGLL